MMQDLLARNAIVVGENSYDNNNNNNEDMDLLELALRLRWSSVVVRANQNPDDIAAQDADGLTVLHWACCNPPPLAIVRALLYHTTPAQRACVTLDYNGMTPLLCACACGAPTEMIAALVEVCPDSAILADADGWTALHYVCYRSNRTGVVTEDGAGSFSNDSIQTAFRKALVLLRAHPSLASRMDSMGGTPLDLLCSMYELELQNAYLFLDAITLGLPFSNASSSLNAKHLWNLLKLLVETYHSCSQNSPHSRLPLEIDATTPNTTTLTILHKILSLPHDAPASLLLLFAYGQQPELTMVPDQDGNTPLHLAVSLGKDSLATLLAQQDLRPLRIMNHRGQTPLALACTRLRRMRRSQEDEENRTNGDDHALNAEGISVSTSQLSQLSASQVSLSNLLLFFLLANPVALDALQLPDACYPQVMSLGCIRHETSVLFDILRSRPSLVRPPVESQLSKQQLNHNG